MIKGWAKSARPLFAQPLPLRSRRLWLVASALRPRARNEPARRTAPFRFRGSRELGEQNRSQMQCHGTSIVLRNGNDHDAMCRTKEHCHLKPNRGGEFRKFFIPLHRIRGNMNNELGILNNEWWITCLCSCTKHVRPHHIGTPILPSHFLVLPRGIPLALSYKAVYLLLS